jgi:lysophospholipase L1-like esterase
VWRNLIDVRHEQKLSMFNSSPVSNSAIVFLGNSITEGGNWSELFPDHLVLNRGIGGDVTAGVLKRLDEVVRHAPSKIFICIGTNDIARGVDQKTILLNYKNILETLKTKTPGTRIYVQSLFPVGKGVITGHSNKKVQLLNTELKKLCAEMQITYINLYPNFTDESGYLNPKFTNDKLHLMGAGYLLWKDLIEAYVNEKIEVK